ncbi:MobV family relaxase [Prevotella sp.]|nr:MobV family relaxase [Prevotella sp.]
MGHFSLDFKKAKGSSDARESDHIERKVIPDNADPTRTHLNRELVKMPSGVYGRDEAIAHRIKTAGIKRKITNDQVRVIRTVLSGTHEDMMNIAANGQLDDWCNDSLKWLQDTFGKENVVSVVLHMDEHTPHLHASLMRGIRGSDARHTTTAQYYRNIKRETERLQNCMKLLQSDVEEAEQLLQQTKSEISTEKLQAAKMEAKTALLSKIGSLLGSGKLKEVEQHNRKLCELVTDREQYIDELHEKVQRMEDSHSKQLGEMRQKHQSEVANLESKHTEEVSLLNDIIRKAKRWFPMLDARLQMEDLCRKIGFSIEQIGVLLTGKALNFSGSLYSEEHRRKFKVENAEIKVFADSTKPNQLFLYVNRQPIVEWFKEQWNNLKLHLFSQRKSLRL